MSNILRVFRIPSQSFHIVIVSADPLVIVTAICFIVYPIVRIYICFDYLPLPLCPPLAHKADKSDCLKHHQENHNTSQRKAPDQQCTKFT